MDIAQFFKIVVDFKMIEGWFWTIEYIFYFFLTFVCVIFKVENTQVLTIITIGTYIRRLAAK